MERFAKTPLFTATTAGIQLLLSGQPGIQTYDVAGVPVISRKTSEALKDALLFIGTPPITDKYISIPSDVTIDEVSIFTIDESISAKYLGKITPTQQGTGKPTDAPSIRATIANAMIEKEYKKGRYFPLDAEYISPLIAKPQGYKFLSILIDGYVPKTKTPFSAFDTSEKKFEFEIMTEKYAPLAFGNSNTGLIFSCIPDIPDEFQKIRYKIKFPKLSSPPLIETPILDSVSIILMRDKPQLLLMAEIAD